MNRGKETKVDLEKIIENDRRDGTYSSYEPTTNELDDRNPPVGDSDSGASDSSSDQASE